MRIALAQSDIIWENKVLNLSVAESFIEQGVKEKVDLILFPEMSFTGFTMSTNNMADSNGETEEYIKNLALKNKINIGIGYIELNNGNSKAKNNYSIISKEGIVLSTYSKIHPFSFGTENLYYEGGEDISYATIEDFIISTFICYDLRFPEIFQLSSKKAGLITVAANWPSSRKDHWITLLRARAIENQCFIAGINRVGTGDGIEYSGNSLIIDPLGNIISSSMENMEGLIIGDLDISLLESTRNNFKLKEDRKEALYYKLYRNA